MEYVTLLALGKWDNREQLDYVPVNEKINGRQYNAFGIAVENSVSPALTRRPYRMEETGNITYVMYDDDSRVDVPIYKTVEM